MGVSRTGSKPTIEQLRALVDLLRANEHRASSIEAQDRVRDAIELFEEYDAGRSVHHE
jgi:hypothetical protein